jgi:hypothetical protein
MDHFVMRSKSGTRGWLPLSCALVPKDFLSTILVSTFLIRCIRNVSDKKALTNRTLLPRKSVCIVRIEGSFCEIF